MLNISVEKTKQKDFDISLHIKAINPIDNNTIYYLASNPPNFITSFSGSALPYHNKEQAYDNTPNVGYITLNEHNEGIIYLRYPNSFYENLGNTLVKPHVKIYFETDSKPNEILVKLSEGIPYRSLTYPMNRTSSDFYGTLWNLPVRSQEEILRSSSFPNEDIHYVDFWGQRPPK